MPHLQSTVKKVLFIKIISKEVKNVDKYGMVYNESTNAV